MKRIRFMYSAGYAGTDGHKDILVEDSATQNKLDCQALDMMVANLLEREATYREIADDDDSWEGE